MQNIPKGGNLWSDYNGHDKMQGPEQDAPGSDGFGDAPYMISGSGKDQYPIMGQPDQADRHPFQRDKSCESKSG